MKPALFSANSAGACPECKGNGVIYTDLAFMAGVVSVVRGVRGQALHRRGARVPAARREHRRRARDVGRGGGGLLHREGGARRCSARSATSGSATSGSASRSRRCPAASASGIKLAIEVDRAADVLVLDEPTTGLHMDDVDKLVDLLDALVDRGRTMIVIEHDLDVVARADWVIDLGPGRATTAAGRVRGVTARSARRRGLAHRRAPPRARRLPVALGVARQREPVGAAAAGELAAAVAARVALALPALAVAELRARILRAVGL